AAAALAPGEPGAVLRHPHPPAGAAAPREGGPGGDALVGGDALPLPRRGRLRLPGPRPPALETARPSGQVPVAAPGRAVAARDGGAAAQGDVPGAVRQLL